MEHKCGLVISSYPNNPLSLFKQILTQELQVQVVYVGPHLSQVVTYLETSPTSGTSYILLHYTPSVLTTKYSFTPILFPQCSDPLLQRGQDPNCKYAPNKLKKIVLDFYTIKPKHSSHS